MNAKITLTVPMEKIPNEVARVLLGITDELEDLLRLTRECYQNTDYMQTVADIDGIRKRLSVVDFNYEDCYTILVGYIKYTAEKRLAEMQSQERKNDTQSNG